MVKLQEPKSNDCSICTFFVYNLIVIWKDINYLKLRSLYQHNNFPDHNDSDKRH